MATPTTNIAIPIELLAVEALVAEAAVEGFHESILPAAEIAREAIAQTIAWFKPGCATDMGTERKRLEDAHREIDQHLGLHRERKGLINQEQGGKP